MFQDLITGLDIRPYLIYYLYNMIQVNISELKKNPSKSISFASDYPVAIENRNKVTAYLVGKELFENIIAYIENFIDKREIDKTDYSRSRDFEETAKELGL